MGFILYDNPEAFKGPIPTPVYARLATVPNIIGAKYMSLTPKYWADAEAVQGKMRLLPLEVDWFLAHMLVPDRALACWSGSVICGPEPFSTCAKPCAAKIMMRLVGSPHAWIGAMRPISPGKISAKLLEIQYSDCEDAFQRSWLYQFRSNPPSLSHHAFSLYRRST